MAHCSSSRRSSVAKKAKSSSSTNKRRPHNREATAATATAASTAKPNGDNLLVYDAVCSNGCPAAHLPTMEAPPLRPPPGMRSFGASASILPTISARPVTLPFRLTMSASSHRKTRPNPALMLPWAQASLSARHLASGHQFTRGASSRAPCLNPICWHRDSTSSCLSGALTIPEGCHGSQSVNSAGISAPSWARMAWLSSGGAVVPKRTPVAKSSQKNVSGEQVLGAAPQPIHFMVPRVKRSTSIPLPGAP
mmetsp:Transcript_69260/g.176067  ORF Transcript_69260/g.176067 Transcript_69260/m.176067 type:complete len:251 (+) Transcript_69260:74-826(+)